MVGEMNVTGVDIGVLQSDHVYGELDEYYHEAMQRYPHRFIALAKAHGVADPTPRLERVLKKQREDYSRFQIPQLLKDCFPGLLQQLSEEDGDLNIITLVGEISATSVQDKIQDLIEQEDSAKPLSDEVISRTLKQGGISAARRTVTKYREKLGIPSSTKRRRKWK